MQQRTLNKLKYLNIILRSSLIFLSFLLLVKPFKLWEKKKKDNFQ